MKIVKTFNDFIKINENMEPIETPKSVHEMEHTSEDESDIIDAQEEGEEESGVYKGTLLIDELAEKLGAEVKNNEIDYKGFKINYFSETENFHVGNKKFDTIEEVIDFVNPIKESVKHRTSKRRK
jgi:hypothetical protein